MAVTCGFFNSVEGDRKYDATQFASLFDGVITDGVVAAVGEFFATTPGGGMNVKVGTGRAWFNRTWTYSDSKVPLTIPASDLLYDRIDAVVLEVDTRIAVRNNSIKVVKGTAAAKPSNPPLTNTTDVHQYALAYVRVKHGATTIGAGDITINVGQASCPFVTSIVETPELDALFARWDAQFQEWFNNIQAQLEGNIATNLQNQINQRVKIADKANGEEVKAGIIETKWVTPKSIAVGFGIKHPSFLIFLKTETFSVNPKMEHSVALPGFVGDTLRAMNALIIHIILWSDSPLTETSMSIRCVPTGDDGFSYTETLADFTPATINKNQQHFLVPFRKRSTTLNDVQEFAGPFTGASSGLRLGTAGGQLKVNRYGDSSPSAPIHFLVNFYYALGGGI